MKISVILPVCDVPIGSGRPHYWLKNCIESVRQGGHEDFELLIGCDGHVEPIHDLVNDFHDPRLVYVPFDRTRSWGNYQCHRLLKEWARGGHVMWMNHDDEFTKDALKIAAEEIESFPDRPIFFRAKIGCNALVWLEQKRPNESSSHVEVHVLATVTPINALTPAYPTWKERVKKADLWWVTQVFDSFTAAGKPPVWSRDVLVNVRPWAPQEPMPGRLDQATTLEAV